MGRQLQRQPSEVQFENYHPGCLRGVLQILHYHHRNSVKKMAPHKKHRRGRRTICFGNPKTISIERDPGEVRSFLDAEADNFLVEQDTKNYDSIDKSSGKSSIKALINEEMSKEENHKHLLFGMPTQSKLQRTYSIHHLEPSDLGLSKVSTDWTNPIIVLHKNANTSSSKLKGSSLKKARRKLDVIRKTSDVSDHGNVEDKLGQHRPSGRHAQLKPDQVMETSKSQNQMNAKQLNREVLHHQVKEYVDVLEIFKVNKELFLKILQDPDIRISEQQISNKKAKLSKSGSFPVADSSRVRYLRPITLEQKQNETWIFPKAETSISSTQIPKLDSARSQEGYNLKTVPPSADDNVDSAIKNKASISSQGSSQLSNPQSWNRLVRGHLRDIKQRIKHAIKEGKKESNHSNTLPRAPSECTLMSDGKEKPISSENASMGGQDGMENSRSCHEIDGSHDDLSNSRLSHMKRTTSLNESLDRYAQLLESSFNREAKLPHSRSLKLRNEDEISSRERAPKFFRRISSLSEIESFWSLINEVAHDSDMPVSDAVDSNANTASDGHGETNSSGFSLDADNLKPLDPIAETDFQQNMAQGSDDYSGIECSGALMVDKNDEEIAMAGEFGESGVDLLQVASIPPQDQEIGSMMNPSVCLAQPSPYSVPQACCPDKTIDPPEPPVSEGSELNSVCIRKDEADSSFSIQNRPVVDSLPDLCGKVNYEDNHLLHFEFGDNDASFNYVRDVLQLSGFIGNECAGTWYSVDQPLNPLLFKELEAHLHKELQCSIEELGGNCDHLLLFDLVNEALVEIYDKSFTYFPRAFSFNCHIRPMPKGNRVLDEVWSKICKYLSFRSDLDRSLDDIVAQDLSKSDGWMTHQFETECVALEMEDLIFDELLEELICL